jgi:hypothetical protein
MHTNCEDKKKTGYNSKNLYKLKQFNLMLKQFNLIEPSKTYREWPYALGDMSATGTQHSKGLKGSVLIMPA